MDINNFNTKNINTNDILIEIQQLYGTKFKLYNDTMTFPVKLYREKGFYNKEFSYFKLESKHEGNYTIRIIFKDYLDNSGNVNGCYLEDVSKTDIYTGTEIMLFIKEFLKLVKVERVTLIDNAKINKLPLSFYKFIEKGETYYERFGFYPHITGFFTGLKYGFSQDYPTNLLESCRNELLVCSVGDFIKPYLKYSNSKILKVRVSDVYYRYIYDKISVVNIDIISNLTQGKYDMSFVLFLTSLSHDNFMQFYSLFIDDKLLIKAYLENERINFK